MAPLELIIAVVLVAGPGDSVARTLERAREGDTVRISGRHRERVVIDRRLVLEGDGTAALDGGGSGSVVTVRASGAVVRDLEVSGSGTSLLREDSGVVVEDAANVTLERVRVTESLFGIHVKSSPEARVVGCSVRGLPLHVAQRGDGIRVYGSARSRVERCTVDDVRDVIVWFSEGSSFVGNRVTNARYGLHLMNTADATCEDNAIAHASVGIFSMYSNAVRLRRNRIGPVRGPSGYGIGLKDTDGFAVTGNVVGDARVGLFFDQSPLDPAKPGLLEGSHVVGCDVALSFMPSTHDVTMVGNAFVESGVQVEIRGGGALRGNVLERGGRGNYWSDYDGFDSDGDGVGETPYRSVNLYEALVDRHPDLELFEGGLAARAIDWGARVVPLIAPAPKVEDARPLVHAPPLPGAPGPEQPTGSSILGLSGVALVVLGAVVVAIGIGRDP
jgi:nitrous oxidase accessory protein